MSSSETTVLIQPASLEEIPRAVKRLCNDLGVGGILLNEELAAILVNERFASLAEGLPVEEAIVRRVTKPSTFDQDHEWHLARTSEDPKLRFWRHHKGTIHFAVSRALPDWSVPSWYADDDEVTKLSYARPVEFTPAPGEAFIFVDQGCLAITGTSSFHKTELRGAGWKNTRESIVNDIIFDV